MENQDIFNKIKTAAEKAATKDSPSMDKVWSRVEDKLDNKVLHKENNLWKKLAVAASILLVTSIAYQFFKTDKEIVNPQNNIVLKDDIETIIKDSLPNNNSIVEAETTNPLIKKEAEKILKEQITAAEKVAITEKTIIDPVSAPTSILESKSDNESVNDNKSESKKTNFRLKGRFFDAIGVRHNTQEVVAKKSEVQETKNAPLVVIDGNAIANSKKDGTQTLSELDNTEIESIVELKEPLYIINGVYYSEEDLFGKKPTSPYAPLDKQEIKTIKILQDEEAIATYGEKGKKGVVIITTKTGKPAVPK
jgi:hypothetical protein